MVAKELKAGDTLELANGRTIKLVKVEVAFHEQPVAVYNFEVADWHTYYVGEDSLLVHNAKPCPGGGKNFKQLNNNRIEKAGYDAHDIKHEVLNTNKNTAKFDLYLNNETKEIFIFRKGGKGDGIPTGYFIE